MNKQKALLDSLMGTHRDKRASEKTGEEFRDKSICKNFLVGFCPDHRFGVMLTKERNPLDQRPLAPVRCTLEHPVAMKTQFEQHPKSESYRRDWEDALLRR